MTPKNLAYFITVLLTAFFLGCSKKDEPPAETCFDKIKNQNEVNTDCGGKCAPCPHSMTAKVDGNSWKADTASISSSYSSTGSKLLLKGNAAGFYPQISLVCLGSFSLGGHPLDPSSSFTHDFNSLPTFVSSGTLTISEMDTRNNLISGSFQFTSTDLNSTVTYHITEGEFVNIKYVLN